MEAPYNQYVLLIADKLIIALILLFFGLWINKKLERFKAEIREHEIRFGKLHEKRLEVITDLYSLLSDARTKLGAIRLAVDENMEAKMVEGMAKKASESCSKADSLLKANRLYLNRKLADSIQFVLDSMMVSSEAYQYSQLQSKTFDTWKQKELEITKILANLENEFGAVRNFV